MIDHDRLFKELLSTFLAEFIELFLPEVMAYLEPDSITFLDKEVFTDVTAGERYETDLLAQVQFQGEPSFFLIHIENQASYQSAFGKRMFRYFARLYEKYDYPIYPIVVFSYDQPIAAAPSEFKVEFPDFLVLKFNYRVIQLNQLNWRDFLTQKNPVAAALMAKMKIAPSDRPKVKAECLRLLVTLNLDPARIQLISGFVDTYLRLNPDEKLEFDATLEKADPIVRGEVMEIVTSWQLEGR
ncbi:MAG: Rpn family recombination-promoting nuclease/putative transposase, partial [Cyanobacteria bacterium P01_A01_bin.17]